MKRLVFGVHGVCSGTARTTALIEASFFPDKLSLYKTMCSYGGPVWVSGRVIEHLFSLSLDCCGCGRIA
jgi:hypothetical protein